MKTLIYSSPMILTLILFSLNKILSKKSKSSPQNILNSPFECGFTNTLKTNSIMANNFFIFSILFLILELEIILIMPFIIPMQKTNFESITFLLIIFTITLLMIMEWKNKTLIWSK